MAGKRDTGELDNHELSRREFVAEATTSLVKAGVLMPCLLAVARCALPGSGTTVSTDSNNLLTLNFSSYPLLQQVNGSYVVTAVLASGLSRPVAVTRTGSATADAVSAICTHQGCTINSFNGTSYTCPCHGSAFAVSGSVLNGPAATALTAYSASVQAASVQVQLS